MKTVRLLFSDDMARAIVEGRKTVTRRPAMGLDGYAVHPALDLGGVAVKAGIACFEMFGRTYQYARTPCTPGDLLIGRECWCPRSGGSLIIDKLRTSQFYRATDGVGDMKKPSVWPWRPSIHMPDWAARIRRRALGVTVERVQDITEDDAVREGMEREPGSDARYLSPVRGANATRTVHNARQAFRLTWDGIYAAKGLGWDANPWVWRIEFSAENVEGEK